MLKHRIIPVLLTDGNGQCVKPVAFERPYRKLGTMEQYIRVIESRNVDELIIIDIEATSQGREPNFAKLRSWCDNLFCPVTYGGGIRTLDHIRLALENGADKVALHSSFDLTYKAARKFGSQAIVVVYNYFEPTFFDGGGESIELWCNRLQQEGAGEIIITDVEKDGKMEGYNLDLIKEATYIGGVPVVALGGAGSPEDFAQALAAGASAVCAGSLFLYTDHTPKSCAEYLHEQGYPVRIRMV